MLLAQKAYVEGGLALELYCGRLVDELRTTSDEARAHLKALLELLTPIAKSWPSEWCLEANNLAIQVHGGYGYTRDFPVEQYWRDNRLNMIHEGAHGIHGIDLLGRKVVIDGGIALRLLGERIEDAIQLASELAPLRRYTTALSVAWSKLLVATRDAWADGSPEEVLANATPYLQAFGHVVLAWLWLDIARVAATAQGGTGASASQEFYLGKVQCTRYFFDYELPKIDAWLAVAAARTDTCLRMRDEWFET
jgi:butyryl-CoA dehydrogenase